MQPRKESKDDWPAYAEQHGCWETPGDGKRVALFSIVHQQQWKGYEYTVRRVARLIERNIDKKGQMLLTPEIELECWWTSLSLDEQAMIQLYADHGTSEQFHSKFKTDMNIERLPLGKFATNTLVLGTSMLAYNILRLTGQNGLPGADSPKRNKPKDDELKQWCRIC